MLSLVDWLHPYIEKIREQLNPRNTDQAFINYCCDVKPIASGHFAEVIGEICQNGWARQSGHTYQENNKYYRWDYGGLDHKKQIIQFCRS